jgi:hypothetical protein
VFDIPLGNDSRQDCQKNKLFDKREKMRDQSVSAESAKESITIVVVIVIVVIYEVRLKTIAKQSEAHIGNAMHDEQS